MRQGLVVWLLLVVLAVCSVAETTAEEENDVNVADVDQVEENFITNDEVFVPTNEWQPVKEGQAVPAGLHMRLNLQTGEREAKLLDRGDAQDQADRSALAAAPSEEQEDGKAEQARGRHQHMKEALRQAMRDLEGQAAESSQPSLSREELKEALKRFKADRDDVQNPETVQRSQFRPIDELKKDLADLELNIKTDAELISELLVKYQSPALGDEDRITLLEDFEYYVHQVDNAVLFAQNGGLGLVVEDLNHTSAAVQAMAALVLGSAAQNNPAVQVSALESGALQKLVRMLTTTGATVRRRVIFALAAVVRSFPYAQQRLVSEGGLAALVQLFREAGGEKLKLKAVTLLHDMLTEQRDAQTFPNEERRKQYESIPLVSSILDQGWCDVVPSLLAVPDHDYREKVLNCMAVLQPHCPDHFSTQKAVLTRLKTEYEVLAKEEEGEEDKYFSELLECVSGLLKNGDEVREEL